MVNYKLYFNSYLHGTLPNPLDMSCFKASFKSTQHFAWKIWIDQTHKIVCESVKRSMWHRFVPASSLDYQNVRTLNHNPWRWIFDKSEGLQTQPILVFWPKGSKRLSTISLRDKLNILWKDLWKWGVISPGKGFF